MLNTTLCCNVFEKLEHPLNCFLDKKHYISPLEYDIADSVRGSIADVVANKIYDRWRNQ